MSMVVGDSTDLIHGGSGGGAVNFWRSRTSCERKLLVAVAVMTVIIVGLAIAVAVVATMEVEDSVRSTCSPHGKFEYKHVCTICNNTDDALAFTKERRKEDTTLNTVFDGHGILYMASIFTSGDRNEDTCRIMKPVKTWNCQGSKTLNSNKQQNNGILNDNTSGDLAWNTETGSNTTWNIENESNTTWNIASRPNTTWMAETGPNTIWKGIIWTNCTFRGLCTGHSAVSNGHFFSESLNCQEN